MSISDKVENGVGERVTNEFTETQRDSQRDRAWLILKVKEGERRKEGALKR